MLQSPLRYPGGKHSLVPQVIEFLVSNRLDGREFVEPFAGERPWRSISFTRKLSSALQSWNSIRSYSCFGAA